MCVCVYVCVCVCRLKFRKNYDQKCYGKTVGGECELKTIYEH